MSEQEKKRQRIYDLLNAETESNSLCLPYTKQRKKCLQKKELFKEKWGVDDWTEYKKKAF